MRDFLAVVGFFALAYLGACGLAWFFTTPTWVQAVVAIFCAAVLIRFVVFIFKQAAEAFRG